MKKINFRKLLFTASLCLLTGTFLFAQEEDNKKVHIIVKKNDATTVDTSFTIDEDMDKDEIQKMIHELTGMDVKVSHGDKMAHAYAFTSKDSADFDADVKEMEIKVTIGGEGESHTVIHEHGSDDHMKWVDHKSGSHYIIVKDEDGKKKKSEMVFISKEYEGAEKKEVDGKKVIVLESGEKPVIFITKDGKELELSIKDKKSGTDIALDEVKVIVIETSEDGVIKIIVSDKKEKEEQKKKMNKKK